MATATTTVTDGAPVVRALAALGRAFGGAGLRVADPAALLPALRDALQRPGPTVIEVPA